MRFRCGNVSSFWSVESKSQLVVADVLFQTDFGLYLHFEVSELVVADVLFEGKYSNQFFISMKYPRTCILKISNHTLFQMPDRDQRNTIDSLNLSSTV